MGLVEILILSSGVAMDAMAVSICKAPCIGIHERYKMIVLPLLFGLFQMIMPIIGWFIGEHFLSVMKEVNSWIGFILLAIIACNMIYKGIKEFDAPPADAHCNLLTWKEMIALAVATSIDAMVIGVSLAFLEVNFFVIVLAMGITTFLLSVCSMYLGKQLVFLERYAELIGGGVLLAIGINMLLGT